MQFVSEDCEKLTRTSPKNKERENTFVHKTEHYSRKGPADMKVDSFVLSFGCPLVLEKAGQLLVRERER